MNMRIEAYTQVQQVYNTHALKATAEVRKQGLTDAVQISGKGRDMTIAKQAVAKADDVRSEVTEPIRASIANGTYDVSADDFADRLLEKYNAYNALIG
jgi:negative regulator of flagellin synthesis FlgM